VEESIGTDLRAAARNLWRLSRQKRVDADGARPLQRGGYKVVRSVSDECVSNHKAEWYRVRQKEQPFVSEQQKKLGETKGFFMCRISNI